MNNPNPSTSYTSDSDQLIPTANVQQPDQQQSSDVNPLNGQFSLLIIDDEPDIHEVIEDWLLDDQLIILHAQTIDLAKQQMATHAVDVVLIDVGMPDGDGLDLTAEIADEYPAVQKIVMTGAPTTQQTISAMRAGADDFISKPLDMDELQQRINDAMDRRRDDAASDERVNKLKNLVSKMNLARHDISQQVDILCKDLVGAYEDLTGQMDIMEKVGELKAQVGKELDLEQLLHIMLEYLLEKFGATNAAIFLPTKNDQFTVGGYVNFNCATDNPHELLNQMAQTIAPRIAEELEALHLTNNETIKAWLDEDADFLTDYEVMATPCRHNDELMASILIFRDNDTPFDNDQYNLLLAIGPIIAEQISRTIRVHHRLEKFFQEDEAEADPWAMDFGEWQDSDDDDDDWMAA